MATRRTFVCLLASIALLLSAGLSAGAQQENAAVPEYLKGTVAKVEGNALRLKNTSFPDKTLGKRDATVLLDKGTTYYDGAKKVNKDALEPGHLVIVRCRMAGKDRVADLVRIIGGKKL